MTTQDLAHVPGRSHYAFEYFRGGRVFSYAHQIDTVLSFEPKRVLEVGVGAGVVAAALRAMGIEVITVDIQPELEPDIVGSVTELPIEDNVFDVALCCQVLEHLPFDEFIPALSELRRVARSGIVLSLPDATPHYELRLCMPRIRRLRWTGSRRRDPGTEWKSKKWKLNGHYWEIGYDSIDVQALKNAFDATGLRIDRIWRVPEMVYHRFFRLIRTQ